MLRSLHSRWPLAPPLGVVALLLGALIVGAGIVYAANLIPNPSFESLCGALPCNWTAGQNTTVTSSTTAHTGSRSVQVAKPAGTSVSPSLVSDCATGETSPLGLYDVAFWYNTTDPDVARNGLGLVYVCYPTPNCSGQSNSGTVSFGGPQQLSNVA